MDGTTSKELWKELSSCAKKIRFSVVNKLHLAQPSGVDPLSEPKGLTLTFSKNPLNLFIRPQRVKTNVERTLS